MFRWIWWSLEQHISADADAVSNWLEEADVWHAPIFAGHIASRIARRLSAHRGDAVTFRRIDPESNWKEYAQHPRNLMPGGKGNYTDWETNYTPETSERNLARVVRLLAMAPAAHRDRLVAGAKASLEQGSRPATVPAKLTALIGEFEKTHAVAEDSARGETGRGRTDFLTYCAPCHQADGTGMDRLRENHSETPSGCSGTRKCWPGSP